MNRNSMVSSSQVICVHPLKEVEFNKILNKRTEVKIVNRMVKISMKVMNMKIKGLTVIIIWKFITNSRAIYN